MIRKGKCAIFSNSSKFSGHSIVCNSLIKDLLHIVKSSLLKRTLTGQVTLQQVLLCRKYQKVMPLRITEAYSTTSPSLDQKIIQWSMTEAGWSPCWPQDPFAALTQAHSSRHRRGPGPWKKNILFCKNLTKLLLYLRFADGSSDVTTPIRARIWVNSQFSFCFERWNLRGRK